MRKYRQALCANIRESNNLKNQALDLVNKWNATTDRSKHECADELLDLIVEHTSDPLGILSSNNHTQTGAKNIVIDGRPYYRDSRGALWSENQDSK